MLFELLRTVIVLIFARKTKKIAVGSSLVSLHKVVTYEIGCAYMSTRRQRNKCGAAKIARILRPCLGSLLSGQAKRRQLSCCIPQQRCNVTWWLFHNSPKLRYKPILLKNKSSELRRKLLKAEIIDHLIWTMVWTATLATTWHGRFVICTKQPALFNSLNNFWIAQN